LLVRIRPKLSPTLFPYTTLFRSTRHRVLNTLARAPVVQPHPSEVYVGELRQRGELGGCTRSAARRVEGAALAHPNSFPRSSRLLAACCLRICASRAQSS